MACAATKYVAETSRSRSMAARSPARASASAVSTSWVSTSAAARPSGAPPRVMPGAASPKIVRPMWAMTSRPSAAPTVGSPLAGTRGATTLASLARTLPDRLTPSATTTPASSWRAVIAALPSG